MKITADDLRVIYEQAHADNQARRARVLKHPDLAQRLVTELGFDRPEQWNGYVAPAWDQEQEPEILQDPYRRPHPKLRRTPPQRKNDSPRRAALVAICQEAMRRDTTQEGKPS